MFLLVCAFLFLQFVESPPADPAPEVTLPAITLQPPGALFWVRLLTAGFWLAVTVLPFWWVANRDDSSRAQALLPFLFPLLGLIVWYGKDFLYWRELIGILLASVGMLVIVTPGDTMSAWLPPAAKPHQRWVKLGAGLVGVLLAVGLAATLSLYQTLGVLLAGVFIFWSFLKSISLPADRNPYALMGVTATFTILLIVAVNWAVSTAHWLNQGAVLLYSIMLLLMVSAMVLESQPRPISILEPDRYAYPILGLAVIAVLIGLFGLSIFGDLRWLELAVSFVVFATTGGALGAGVVFLLMSVQD